MCQAGPMQAVTSLRFHSSTIASALSAGLLVTSLLATPLSAQSVCPDEHTAPKGYTLTNKDGWLVDVTRIEGARVEFNERPGNGPGLKTRAHTSFQGLIALTTKLDSGEVSVTFEDDLAKLFPLKTASTHELAYIINLPDKKQRRAHMSVEVLAGPVPVSIGPCGYDTWRVKRSILFFDSQQLTIITDHWSPVLRMFLRREMMPAGAPGQPPIVISFDTITPRK